MVFSSTSTGSADTYTVRACIYIPRSCPLSFDDMKVRGEQVSLVGWHNRNSSSQGPSSLLFFAHSQDNNSASFSYSRTLDVLLLEYSWCGLTSALKSHTRVSLTRVSNDLRRRPRTLFALFTCASVCLSTFCKYAGNWCYTMACTAAHSGQEQFRKK